MDVQKWIEFFTRNARRRFLADMEGGCKPPPEGIAVEGGIS